MNDMIPEPPPAEPDPRFDDVPPPDAPDGPEDPADYVYFSPDEKPYTVIMFSPEAALQGGDPLAGTAITHIHAVSAVEAGGLALQNLQQEVKSPAWHFAEVIFVTEGYHHDMRPDPRRFQL